MSDLRNKQKAMLLSNHSGPHCKDYLDQIEQRLDVAHESLGSSKNPAKCADALNEVIDDVTKDIRRGDLQPYNPPKRVKSVPNMKPRPYGRTRGVKACGKVLGVGLDLHGMIDMLVPRTQHLYYHRDGTIRDDAGNIIGWWQA